jgi:hypothetical protein
MVEERVKKAIAIVSASNNIIVEAYIALQWKRVVQANEYWDKKIDETKVKNSQDQIRKALWI